MTADARLVALVRGLRRAQSGIRGRLLLRDACIGGGGVLAAVALSRLVGAFVPGARFWSALPIWSGGVVAAAVVLAAVAGWLHVCRRAPSVAELARQADARYGLQERLSTALEVGAPDAPPATALRERFLADAAGRAEVVEPRDLIDVPLAIPTRWLALAVAAVIAVQFVPLRTGRPSALGANAAAPAASQAIAVPTVTDVQTAAALVAQDAFVRNDLQLRQIAASLQDLGARMASGQIGPGQVARQVTRLRMQLEAAYGALRPTTGAPAGSHQTPGASGARPPRPATSGAGRQAGQGSGASIHLRVKPGSANSLSDLVQQLEAGAPNHSHPKAPGAGTLSRMGSTPGSGQSVRGGYARENPSQTALFKRMNALFDQPGVPGGQPVGAARHATQGPGDAAGHGSQPLAQGAAAPGRAAAAKGAKVDLPGNPIAGGQRIQLEAAPTAKRTQVTDVVPGAAVAGAPPSETALPIGSIVDALEREAVGRYFLPSGGPAPGPTAGAAGAP